MPTRRSYAYPGSHENAEDQWLPTGPVTEVRTDASGNYSETLTYAWTDVAALQSDVSNNAPTAQSLTGGDVAVESLSRSVFDDSGPVDLEHATIRELRQHLLHHDAGGLRHFRRELPGNRFYLRPVGPRESTISPDGTVSFTAYDAFGDAACQWAGTTTATTQLTTSAAMTNFRNWLARTWTPGTLTYTGSSETYVANLYLASSSAYNADGGLTATTAYVDGNASHDRVTSYGYDWHNEQTYAVSPADDQGNVSYTMTTYDNLGEAITTQQYAYRGSETNGIPDGLAQVTSDPPQKLDSSDTLLSQANTAYDDCGEVYQTQTCIVSNGSVVPAETETTNYWHDLDGNQVAVEDPDGNFTLSWLDGTGQVVQSTQGQMVAGEDTWTFGDLAQTSLTAAPRTYDIEVHFASAPGDDWQQNFFVNDPDGGPSFIAWANPPASSDDGWYEFGTVTLAANDNSTSVTLLDSPLWQYPGYVFPDEVCLGYATEFSYYANGAAGAGQLEQQTDRDGNATTFQYNTIGQETGENWYAGSDPDTAPLTETITNDYNDAGWLQSSTDDNLVNSTVATDAYTYDMAGEVTSDTQSAPGMGTLVTLSEGYTGGDRTQVAAFFGGTVDQGTGQVSGGTADYVNNYIYGGVMGQMSQVTQQANGGDAVASKAATFGYDYQGEFTGIDRYNTAGASQLTVQSGYAYDNDGNVLTLDYQDGESTPATLDNFTFTYNTLGEVATSQSSLDSGAVTYTDDSTGQTHRRQRRARAHRGVHL